MKFDTFTQSQKRALAIVTVLALLFGAYFLRHYFTVIVLAAIISFLFLPLYKRLLKKMSSGLAVTLTFFAALLIVIIPLTAIVVVAVLQITGLVNHAAESLQGADLSHTGDQLIKSANDVLDKIPYVSYHLTESSVTSNISHFTKVGGNWLLNFLSSTASSFFGSLTSAVLFVYVFISMLVSHDKLLVLLRQLNPLGDEITDMYLAKTGAMVKGTVKGQFVIALCQGLAGAISIYVAGFHDAFFIFFLGLSALSVIPLGSGIVTIPFAIGMALFGHVGGGLVILLWHLLITTNIDNVLRPILVPRQARLDPALMMLAVFSGIAMFGFLGIVIGPVLMVLIVTTIKVYLAVYRGVPLNEVRDKKVRRWQFRTRRKLEA